MTRGSDGEPPRLGPPKSVLQRMLADAVRNTVAAQTKPTPEDEAGDFNESVEAIKPSPEPEQRALPVQADRRKRPVSVASNQSAKRDKATMTPIIPTADQVGAAIVAAARACNEDPLRINGGRATIHMRCRHYAMHALFHCFPGLPRATYAKLVGCPGLPNKFYENSKLNVIALLPGPGNRRRTQWWSERTYADTIAAIEAVK